MKKTTIYLLRSLAVFLGLRTFYILISWIRGNITYAYESQQLQEAILSTDTQIQHNSTRRNEIDEQIKQLNQQITTLRQEQATLQSTNTQLRKTLSQQKDDYQDFLGFNSGR